MKSLNLAILAAATLASKAASLPDRAFSPLYTIKTVPFTATAFSVNTALSTVAATHHTSLTTCSRLKEGSPGVIYVCPDPTSPGKVTTITPPEYKPTKRDEDASTSSQSSHLSLTSPGLTSWSHTTHYRVPPTFYPSAPVEERSLAKRHDWAMVCKPIEDALGKIDMQKECKDLGIYCDKNGNLIGNRDEGCHEFCDCHNIRSGITKAGCNGRVIKGTQPYVSPGYAPCDATRRSLLYERLSRRSDVAQDSSLVASRPLSRRHTWAMICHVLSSQTKCTPIMFCSGLGVLFAQAGVTNLKGCDEDCDCYNVATGAFNPGLNDRPPPPPPLPWCPPGSKICGLKSRSLDRRHDWAMICESSKFQKQCTHIAYCDARGVLIIHDEIDDLEDCHLRCNCHNLKTGVSNPGSSDFPPPPHIPWCPPGSKTCGLKTRSLNTRSLNRRHDWALICNAAQTQKKCARIAFCSADGILYFQDEVTDTKDCDHDCACHNVKTGVSNPGTNDHPPPAPVLLCPVGWKTCGLKTMLSRRGERSHHEDLSRRQEQHDWAVVCHSAEAQKRCQQAIYCTASGVMSWQAGVETPAGCFQDCDCHNLKTGVTNPGTNPFQPPKPPLGWCPPGSKTCGLKIRLSRRGNDNREPKPLPGLREQGLSLHRRQIHDWGLLCNNRDSQNECSKTCYCQAGGNMACRDRPANEGVCRQRCGCYNVKTGTMQPGTRTGPPPPPFEFCPPGSKTCGLKEESLLLRRREDDGPNESRRGIEKDESRSQSLSVHNSWTHHPTASPIFRSSPTRTPISVPTSHTTRASSSAFPPHVPIPVPTHV